MLRQALDQVSVAAIIAEGPGSGGRVLYANAASAALTGLEPAALVGRPLCDLLPDPAITDVGAVREIRTRGDARAAVSTIPLYEQPGRVAAWLLTGSSDANAASPPASDLAGTPAFIGTDTWVRAVRGERSDVATGMPSRSAFEEILRRDWGDARREQRRLTVAVFRIDEFESYTTLFGRHAADSCARRVGHVIGNSLRRSADYCARVADDRFAMLVRDSEAEKVSAFAGRIAEQVRCLAIHHPRSTLGRFVVVSCGVVSLVPGRADEECDLLEQAETAVGQQAGQPQEKQSASGR